jgi:D-xylulose reductase
MIVFDLPQLHTKPLAETLLETLKSLKRGPKSWTKNASESVQDPKGLEKYLTSIISSPLKWISDDEIKEQIWEEASLRLSERAGRSGMSAMDRSFKIPRESDSVEISIHEPALTADHLGLKTWAASYVLACRLRHYKPMQFVEHGTVQALELGSGTGLVGMAAAAVWGISVILTDLPFISDNLANNVRKNEQVIKESGGTAVSGVLDWSLPNELHLSEDIETPQKFPVVLAADSIYSADHPRMLAQSIKQWLQRGPKSRAIVALPLRFGYEAEIKSFPTQMEKAGFKLVFEEKEDGYDDWGKDDGLVTCWLTEWAWNT